MLRGRLPVRADRRSRTDKKPSVRNRRSRIKPHTVFAVNSNRDFRADAFYPRGNHGSRAQRATALAACGSTYVAANNVVPAKAGIQQAPEIPGFPPRFRGD
jgi:hypothetical protein